MKNAPLNRIRVDLETLRQNWSESDSDYAELQIIVDRYNAINDKMNRFFHKLGATLDHLELLGLWSTGVYHLIEIHKTGQCGDPTYKITPADNVLSGMLFVIAFSINRIENYRRVIHRDEIATPVSVDERVTKTVANLNKRSFWDLFYFQLEQSRHMRTAYFGVSDTEIEKSHSAYYIDRHNESGIALAFWANVRRYRQQQRLKLSE